MLLETLRSQVLREAEIGSPFLDASVRAGVLSVEAVVQALPALETPGSTHLRALVLLWHDHLDASHQLSQGLEDASGAYLHGMMHRREGDYGNAKYWFHRAGPQKALAVLEARLASQEADRFLLDQGRWNAEAFVDCCASSAAASRERYRAIQGTEFLALAGAFLSQQQ